MYLYIFIFIKSIQS